LEGLLPNAMRGIKNYWMSHRANQSKKLKIYVDYDQDKSTLIPKQSLQD